MLKRTVMLLVALGIAGSSVAQEPAPPPTPPPTPLPVPEPREAFGAEEAPRSAQIHTYLRRLAEASPRVYVETLGATEEGREILLVAVSSESHLSDLDRLTNISLALTDPRLTPPDEADLLTQGGQPFVYLLGAVPPERTATPRRLVEVAHRLAVSDDPQWAEIRERAVVLMTPVADPDGYDRIVDWRRAHPGVDVPVPWRGYYASPDRLTDDPALVLPGIEAAADVVRRFRPQRVLAVEDDVAETRRELEGVARTGSELLVGAYLQAEASVERGRTEPPFAWIFPPDPVDPTPRAELFDLLVRYGVEVHRVTGDLAVDGRVFPEGSFLVRSDQPGRDLAVALLEGRLPPGNGTGSPFLGRPTNLPILLGARGLRVDDPAVLGVPIRGRDWPPPEEEGRRRRRREPPPEPTVLLEPISDGLGVERPEGAVDGFGEEVFVLRDEGQRGLLTARVVLADHQVDAADEPFRSGGRDYPPGSLLVYAPRSAVETAARETGLTFEAPLSTPDVTRHIADLPRVGIVHAWTDPGSAGWLRLALDRARLAYGFVSPDDLRRGDLRRRFDVLLWPATSGGFQELVHGVEESLGPLPYRRSDDAPSLGVPSASEDVTGGMGFVGLGELERFVRDGGVLAVFGNSARPFVDGGLLGDVGRLREELDTDGAEVRIGVTRPEHPLTYGLGPRDAVFVTSGPVWGTREDARDRAVFRFGHAGLERSRTADADTGSGRSRPPSDSEVMEEDLPLEEPGEEAVESEDLDENPLDVDVETEVPEPAALENLPAAWKQAGPLVLSGDRASGGLLDGRAAVIDQPLGEGRLVIYNFDPFPRYLRRSDLRSVWNLLLHWNDL